MDLPLRVVVDGVGVVEPAVVGVPLLAVHHRVRGVVGLGQLVPVLHFDQVEVAAVFLTCILLLTGAKRPTLDTLSGGNRILLLITMRFALLSRVKQITKPPPKKLKCLTSNNAESFSFI